jgi:hypothetical protein
VARPPTVRVVLADQVVESASPKVSPNPATLGTKWLKFWNYFSLPVGCVLGVLVWIGIPVLGIIMAPISLLQFSVAYGLHNRWLWAWQWNWVLIVIAYISITIPTPMPGSHGGWVDLVVQFIIKLVIGGIVWMWPNHVYWKKRRALFA